jgi:hypothetical protein
MIRCILTAAGLATASLSLAPAATAAPLNDPLHCVGELVMNIAPGIGLQSATGALTSDGETGSLHCDGVAEAGTWGEVGRLTVPTSCANPAGEAVLTWSATLPTGGGGRHLVDRDAHYTFGPLRGGGLIGGEAEGAVHRGTFTVLPMAGDCVSAPITKVLVRCEELIVAKP